MKNKILILTLVCTLVSGCVTPKYTIMKHSQIQSLDLDNSLINYIPLEDEMTTKSALLDSSYKLISAKKYMTLESYVNKLEQSGANSTDFYLAKTLWAITIQNYPVAQKNLNNVNGAEFRLLKRLLTIDLNYEIERQNGSFNYKAYLQKYQDLIDSYPENAVLRKIVAIRLRYLRYNY